MNLHSEVYKYLRMARYFNILNAPIRKSYGFFDKYNKRMYLKILDTIDIDNVIYTDISFYNYYDDIRSFYQKSNSLRFQISWRVF